jgi:sigma-B regulation protein RsbU (phosphoserine phosphatase)
MKDENKQLSVLYELSKVITGASSMENVCDKILERTAAILKVSKASIMKFDPGSGALKIISAKGLPKEIIEKAEIKVGEGVSGKVFKSNSPLLIKDIRSTKFSVRRRYQNTSLMSAPVTCFPMRVGGLPIGVINVTDKKGGGVFTDSDLKLLTTIANQTAAYLHLCDMAEEARKAEHLKREIELARDIQRRLLPKARPSIRGLDVAGACLMAEHVGGDYYDFLAGGMMPTAIVVADVSGHSIGAALTMSAFRSAVRSGSAASHMSPAIIADRLNAILYDDLTVAEQFISMVYLQFLPGIVKYTTAGHYPPLILRGKSFINHSTEDLLLGVEKFSEYHEKRIASEKGDIITLYTDGLLSVVGMEHLKRILIKNKNRTAGQIVNLICNQIRLRTAKKPLRDDATMVVVKL